MAEEEATRAAAAEIVGNGVIEVAIGTAAVTEIVVGTGAGSERRDDLPGGAETMTGTGTAGDHMFQKVLQME